MKVDTHQHFWVIEKADYYDFLSLRKGVLYHDYLPSTISSLLSNTKIDYTVVIQAAPNDAETEWLLNLAEQFDFILGVVGWVNLDDDPNKLKERLAILESRKKFVGIRPMLESIREDDWILRPKVLANLKYIADRGYPLDLLIQPRHFPYIYQLMELVPNLRAVINHLGKPELNTSDTDEWFYWISRLSEYSGLWCKISGIVTLKGYDVITRAELTRYIQHVIDQFSHNRIMFGSDWPVCLQRASYSDVVRVMEEITTGLLSPCQLERIFGGNAISFYNLYSN